MAVDVTAMGGVFEAATPHALFETTLELGDPRQTYSVSSDGKRFLLNTPDLTATGALTVVLNWPSLLKK
jgi:hypothetical protein